MRFSFTPIESFWLLDLHLLPFVADTESHFGDQNENRGKREEEKHKTDEEVTNDLPFFQIRRLIE